MFRIIYNPDKLTWFSFISMIKIAIRQDVDSTIIERSFRIIQSVSRAWNSAPKKHRPREHFLSIQDNQQATHLFF
jgi:hypothetical protein